MGVSDLMRYLSVTIAFAMMIFSLLWAAGIVPEARLAAPESSPLFSHDSHVTDQEIECTDCHIDIESSQPANDRDLPTMYECGACHDDEDDETCYQCHTRTIGADLNILDKWVYVDGENTIDCSSAQGLFVIGCWTNIGCQGAENWE